MKQLRVGVSAADEIFWRGVAACLAAAPMADVVPVSPEDVPGGLDVAVVTLDDALARQWPVPLVVCLSAGQQHRVDGRSDVAAVLIRRQITEDALVGSVRAAAAGLRLEPPRPLLGRLDPRKLSVLRLLAEGRSTRDISLELGYSERTIKNVIREIQDQLGARNRAHAVAAAVREQLI